MTRGELEAAGYTLLRVDYHGTESGYRRKKCRCSICRAEHARRERERVSRLKKSGRGPRVQRKPSPPWNSIPTERFWPILEEWMRDNTTPRFFGDEDGGISQLARVVGCDWGSIAKIRERSWIKFSKADRILCAIGRPDLWQTELADLYERERPLSGEKAA